MRVGAPSAHVVNVNVPRLLGASSTPLVISVSACSGSGGGHGVSPTVVATSTSDSTPKLTATVQLASNSPNALPYAVGATDCVTVPTTTLNGNTQRQRSPVYIRALRFVPSHGAWGGDSRHRDRGYRSLMNHIRSQIRPCHASAEKASCFHIISATSWFGTKPARISSVGRGC